MIQYKLVNLTGSYILTAQAIFVCLSRKSAPLTFVFDILLGTVFSMLSISVVYDCICYSAITWNSPFIPMH